MIIICCIRPFHQVGHGFSRAQDKFTKKKRIILYSPGECSDRSKNVRNGFLGKFYIRAILRFFSQLSFFIEIFWSSNRVNRKTWIFIDFPYWPVRKIKGNPDFSIDTVWKSKNFDEKWKLRKKSQYSSPAKFPQESISDVFRTIWALPWAVKNYSVFLYQFDLELFPLGEMAWGGSFL